MNILGAYCPDDQEYLDRRYTDKNLNAQSVIERFERMRERHPETKDFRIYLDNARSQHAKVLKAWVEQTRREHGVVFDRKDLPAYAPNRNLIERLHEEKKALHAVSHEMISGLEQELRQATQGKP